MIKKILEIKDFAVFKDFEWDRHVVDNQGKTVCLQDINIIFGRNYSGKTTLSRIFRSFELKGGLERYESGSFKLELSDGSTIDEKSIENVTNLVRVFNEDFVKDNLLFISNPEEGVTPFAVLGENAQIETEIQKLKADKKRGMKLNSISKGRMQLITFKRPRMTSERLRAT